MQITLKQEHIEAAVKAYVAKAGIAFPVEDIDFTAGRGKSGLTATVEVQDPFASLSDGEGSSEDVPASRDSVKAKNEEPKATTEPEPEPVQDPEPEPVTPAGEEPPFDGPQPAQEKIEEPKQEKASLFS